MVWLWKAFVDEHLCVGCGKCTRVCWTGAIRLADVDKKARVDFRRCVCCTACVRTCPAGAVQIVPYPIGNLEFEELSARLNMVERQLKELTRSIEQL